MFRYILMIAVPVLAYLLDETLSYAVDGVINAVSAGSWQSAVAIALYFLFILGLGRWLVHEGKETLRMI